MRIKDLKPLIPNTKLWDKLEVEIAGKRYPVKQVVNEKGKVVAKVKDNE